MRECEDKFYGPRTPPGWPCPCLEPLWQMVDRMAARATALCLLVTSASHVSLLAHPSQQPSSHAPTPLTFPRDGVGAWRSSHVSAFSARRARAAGELWSSGTARKNGRHGSEMVAASWAASRPHGALLLVISTPRSRC